MKIFLDTSVLVATFYGDHQHHNRSIGVFLAPRKAEAFTAAHCLAELYAVITGMPGRDRASPQEALLFVNDVRERFTLVALTENEYLMTLNETAELGIVGGGLYDDIIAKCALKAKAQAICTWNPKHFQRLGPQIASRVREP